MVPTKFLVGTTLATNGITRVTRKGRPNYPIDFKRHLAARACVSGNSVAKLALEHGINANLLFKWRRHYRAGWFGEPQPAHHATPRPHGCEAPKLLPVTTVSPPGGPSLAPKGVKPAAALEIVIGGATVRVHGEVNRDALRTVLDCLADMQGLVAGRLQIAVVASANCFMLHFLGRFLDSYPDVQPQLTVTNRNRVIERLAANQDDFVVMGRVPEHLALAAHPFLENLLVPIAAPTHALSTVENIPLERLATELFPDA